MVAVIPGEDRAMIQSHDSIRQFDNLTIRQFDKNGIGTYSKQMAVSKRQPLFIYEPEIVTQFHPELSRTYQLNQLIN